MRVIGLIALFELIFLHASAFADDDHALQAQYLANAGVMVAKGDTKVLFDPFFRNDYGAYDLVPSDLEQAVLDGVPPFDGIDAVFVSHNHDDHFDAEILVAYLNRWPDVELYALRRENGLSQEARKVPESQARGSMPSRNCPRRARSRPAPRARLHAQGTLPKRTLYTDPLASLYGAR
jgi:glyoxylase-like metal-dependent hydrolase (beta-lactamase superfamily II)